MDAFVALMTKQFHESDWTDQEVGFAFGRGVPLICVRLGRGPYGFIGKFQALSCEWSEVPKGIATLLLKDSKMIDVLAAAIQSCVNWENGNKLAELLPGLERVSEEQARNLVAAFNGSGEARGSFGLNGLQPRYYGDGLAKHLARVTGRKYEMDSDLIREVKP